MLTHTRNLKFGLELPKVLTEPSEEEKDFPRQMLCLFFIHLQEILQSESWSATVEENCNSTGGQHKWGTPHIY